jgi:hypothetical protein
MDGMARVPKGTSRRGFLIGGSETLKRGQGAATLVTPPFAAYVLNRIGHGSCAGTPFSIGAFNALAATDDERLTVFVDQQLNPTLSPSGDVADPEVDARLAHESYVTLSKSFAQLWLDHEVNAAPSGGVYTRAGRSAKSSAPSSCARCIRAGACSSRWPISGTTISTATASTVTPRRPG